jgi:RimJ/RimL family protein N-acetyltransferase
MNIESLIHTQLQLECIHLNNNGYLTQFQCDNPDPIARLYIYRAARKYYRFIQDNIPPVLRQHLKLLKDKVVFDEIEQIQQTLGEHHACETIFRGKTYILPQDALNLPYEDSNIVYGGSSGCEIVVNGKIVASCTSVREDGTAAEAWVHTHEAYRGQGYGKQVTLAWARRVTQNGKIAFYSHSVDNIASQKLVEKLPFIWCYDLVAYR